MTRDRWQRFANLRAYYTFMFGHPGKKLLFMGCEFAPGARMDLTITASIGNLLGDNPDAMPASPAAS